MLTTFNRSIYNRDGNEYPVNRVLARMSDYRIPKSVFGYSENVFFMKIMIQFFGQ
jgi:hypothetical protein